MLRDFLMFYFWTENWAVPKLGKPRFMTVNFRWCIFHNLWTLLNWGRNWSYWYCHTYCERALKLMISPLNRAKRMMVFFSSKASRHHSVCLEFFVRFINSEIGAKSRKMPVGFFRLWSDESALALFCLVGDGARKVPETFVREIFQNRSSQSIKRLFPGKLSSVAKLTGQIIFFKNMLLHACNVYLYMICSKSKIGVIFS